jgi:hypothetical protein
MKLDLLSSASLLALGTALTLSSPGVAFAGLSCTPLTSTTGFCTETDTLSPANQRADLASVAISIDKFDAAVDAPTVPGAVLTELHVSLGGSYTSSGNIYAPEPPAPGPSVTATYYNSMTLKIGGPGTFPTVSVTAAAPLASYTFATTGTKSFSADETFGAMSSTTGAGLTAFSGTGAFHAYITTLTAVHFSNSGGGTWTDSINTYVDPSVVIRYDYSVPVPEPATLGVLAVGLSGLGVVRRRRKR